MSPFRIAAIVSLVACSRSVPSELPHEESAMPRAGAALVEDPPLPSAPDDGGAWPGLTNPPPAMEHHHHAN